MSDRAVVHVLFTGGTISMRRDPATGAALPALSGREIVARVPGLRREARLRLEDLARLPGPHVTPAWMWRLRRRVEEVLADPRVDGVVITHGTDTREETAYLLDLTVAGPKPVVLTGAMRTFSDAGWDGPANLTAAVRTAAHPGATVGGLLARTVRPHREEHASHHRGCRSRRPAIPRRRAPGSTPRKSTTPSPRFSEP